MASVRGSVESRDAHWARDRYGNYGRTIISRSRASLLGALVGEIDRAQMRVADETAQEEATPGLDDGSFRTAFSKSSIETLRPSSFTSSF